MYLNLRALTPLVENSEEYAQANRLEKMLIKTDSVLYAAWQSAKGLINTRNNIYLDPSYLNPKGSPTFGQMNTAAKYNRAIARKIMNSEGITPSIPLIFVAGEDDDFSAVKQIEKVAKKLRAEFVLVKDGGHKPISQTKQGRKQVFKAMKKIVPEITKQGQSEEKISDYWPDVAKPIGTVPNFGIRMLRKAIGVTQQLLCYRPRGPRMPSVFSRKQP